MENILNDIKNHTPAHLEGYCYVKTQKIYIPFSKLTIHGIEKDTVSLDSFSLSVMQLVAEGITDLEGIAEILGVSDDVFNEAVADMAHIDWVSLSEGKITLTEKGKNSLEQNKRVERRRTVLKNVFVDLITGKVCEDITCSNSKGRYIPLEPIVEIGNEYFSEHFKEIKDLHKMRQKQYQINEYDPVEKELEKIIDSEQSIVYVEKELYIYRSIESDELQFQLNDDDSEGSYQAQFFKQFNQEELITGNRRFFFENVKTDFRDHAIFSPGLELLEKTKEIRNIILSAASNDEKEEAFFQKHYALNDSEYVSFITNSSHRFKFEYILIVCSEDVNILLTEAFCSQLSVISEKIPVFIVFEDDRNGQHWKSIDHLFPKAERGNKLYLIFEADIAEKLGNLESYICYYPRMIVNVTKHISRTGFGDETSPRYISYSTQIYDFDKESIETTAKKIIEVFPKIEHKLESVSQKKAIPKNNSGKNVKSKRFSNYSKPKKYMGSEAMKHSRCHKNDNT